MQASEFAAVGPLPVALLGLGMYATVVICNLVAGSRPEHAVAATSFAFAAALGGTVYAAYLTWLEVAVIGAICQWCVASAVLTAFLAVLEGAAVWGALAAPPASVWRNRRGPRRVSACANTSGTRGKGTAGARRQLTASGKIAT